MSNPIATERLDVPADDGTSVGLYIARPEGSPRGGIIVLQEIFGVNPHIRDVTERFAREGYLAAAPDLFHRQGTWYEGSYTDFAPSRERANQASQDNIRADLRATHAWLAKQLPAIAARIASIGFCMGGRQSFVANGVLPLACAVSFYGSNIPPLGELAASQSGPFMAVWGGLDKGIDLAQRRAVFDLLNGANKPFVDITFSDADHGFFCDMRSHYQPVAARQAWALVKAFFDEHLATKQG